MAGPALRRFWHVYRDNYAQERATRVARERARHVSSAEAGFWVTFGIGVVLNFLSDLVDLDSSAWTALRSVVGLAWLAFGAWFLVEVLSRRKARPRDG